MSSGNTIKVTIPTGITVSGVTTGSTTAWALRTLASGGLVTSPVTTCTYNSNDGGARTMTFTLGQAYTSLTLINLGITASLQNPDSVRFLDSFQVAAGATSITTHDAISYTAATLTSASVTNLVKTAGTPTTMTFTFRITNQIPANGLIRINWPTEVKFKLASADGLVSVTVHGASKTGFTTAIDQSSKQFTFTGLFTSAALSPDTQDIVIAIQSLNNPESQVQSGSFTITTLDASSNAIDQQSTLLTVSSTSPGTITLQSITPNSTAVDQEITVEIYENTDISPTNSFLRISWPSEITYVSSGTLTCDMTFGFTANTPPCTVDTTNNYMTLSYYRSTVHLYKVGIFRNPLGAITTSSWNLQVFDASNNLIMQQDAGITYTTTVQAITVGTSTRPTGTTQVALQANYTLSFTLPTRLLSDSTITLIFPIDQVKYNSSTAWFNGATDLSCTLSDANSTHFQTTLTQWCNAGAECAAGSTVSFILSNAINPSWAVSPLTSSVMIKTNNPQLTGTPIIDEITSGVQFTPTLTPGTLTGFSVTKDSTTNKVGEKTTYNITFTTVTAIPASGKVVLTFPSEAVYKVAATEVTCKDAASATLTCTSTADSSNNVQTVTITSACTSGWAAATTIFVQLEEVYNPGSTKTILTSFQAQTQTTEGYLIDSGTAGTTSGFSLVSNSFTSITTNAPTTVIAVGAITEYRFTVVLNNPIPTTGGKLLVTFPTQLEVQAAGSCTAVISSTSHTCVLSSAANTVTVTFGSTAAAASSLLITIVNGVKNPTVGSQSDAIIFKSTVTETTNEYDIDQDLTTIKIQPNVYGTLTSASVTRLNSSLINTETELDIKATSANPILSGSTIKIEYPLDQAVLNVANTGLITFFQISSAGVVGTAITATSVTSNSTYIIATFAEWWSSGGNPWAAGTENIRFRTIGLKNPPSTFPPSNSFKIFLDTSGSLIIDSIETSLLATPSIQAGPLTSVTISRDSNVTGAVATYTVQFTTTNSITEANGVFFSFTVPTELLYQGASLACTFNGTDATTGCAATYNAVSYGNEVATLKVPMGCAANTWAIGTYNVTFTGFKNPFSTKLPTGTITAATQGFDGTSTYYNNDVLDVVIETSATSLQTLTPNVCTGTAERSVTNADQNTEIVANITLVNRILASSYIRVMVPLEQFARTTDTIQYKETAGATVNAMTVVSTNSTHAVLEYQEFCNGGAALWADGTTMSITITQGFKNPRTVVAAFSNYFIYEALTSDQNYQIDKSTANIEATPTLQQASVTSIAVSFESATVAKDGYVDISAVLGSTILTSDYVDLAFSAEFLIASTAAVTCSKVVSGTATAITCTSTFTSGYLSALKVEGLCACDSTTTYTIRIHNVRNLLEVKAFTGTLTYSTKASASESIGTGTLDLTTVTTLTAGILSPATVIRSATSQGASSTFTLSFITPGVLLDASTIQIGLPLNQIVLDGASFTWIDSSDNAALTWAATPTATSTYNYITINEWKCTSGDCATGQAFGIILSNSKNPAVSAVTTDPFLLNFISPSSNAVFQAPTPLNASPELEVGALNNHVITHQTERYVLSSTEYIIAFDTTTEIPAGGKIIFTFPDNRIWKDATSTLTVTTGTTFGTTVTGVTATYDGTGTWLTMLELGSQCGTACAIASFSFKISGGIKNPDNVQTLTGNFVTYTTDASGAVVNRDIKPNSDVTEILAAPMTATIVRNVDLLSTATNLTVSFKTVNSFPQNGKIIFKMPTDQIVTDTTLVCRKGDLSTTLTCSIATSGSYYVITINEWCTVSSSTCSAGAELSFIIEGMKNPSLLAANVATTSWEVLTATSNSDTIDGAYTSLKPTPDLQGVGITLSSVAVSDATVNKDTQILFNFTPNSDLPSGALVAIGFPAEFALAPTTQSCSQILPSSSSLTWTYTESGGYLTTITISNPCANSAWLSSTVTAYQMNIKIRENTKDVGGTFTVTTKTSSADIGLGSLANSITINPNPFTSTSFDNSGCDTVGATCSLQVKFTTVYTFPNKASNGKIDMTLPSDLTIISSGCTATIAGNAMEWSRVGTSVTITHSQTASVASQEIILTFASITNPTSTKPTNTFVIYSQEQVSGTYYSIDGVTTGFTYSVSTLGSISSVTVTRDNINADNDGLKVNRATNFKFVFTIGNAVPDDGAFTFIMPTESDAQIDSSSTTFTCKSGDWTTGSALTCTATSATRTVLVSDYCTVAGAGSCNAATAVTIWLTSSFMKNMGWIKSPLVSTDSFEIKSGITGGLYFIDNINASVTATPDLITDLISFGTPNFARDNNTVNAKINWDLTVTFTTNSLPQDGYIYFTLPDDVVYTMGYTVTTTLTSNSSASATTTVTTHSSGAVNVLTLKSVWGSSSWATSSSLQIRVAWVKNPPAVTTATGTIAVNSVTSQGWLIDAGVSSAINTVFSTLTLEKVSSIDISPEDPSAGAITNYDIIFTANTDIPQNSYVVITLPTDITISGTNTGGATSLNTCANIFTTTATLTCVVTTSGGTTTVRVNGLFPDATNSGQFGSKIGLLVNPSAAGQTGVFQIDIFSPSGDQIASEDNAADTNTGTITTDIPDAQCDSSCKTCSGTTTSCDSCNSPSNQPFFENNKWVTEWSSGYFLDGTTCYKCHERCTEWSGHADSNCLSCTTNFYFQNGYWVSYCGQNTEISNGNCQSNFTNGSCNSSCATCSQSLDWWLTCPTTGSTSIVNPSNGQCVCSDVACWGTGYYVDTTTTSCQPWSEKCADCELSSTSCWACHSFFVDNILDWSKYEWVSTWSSNTYFDATTNTWPACNPVCLTCALNTPSTCLSCNKTEKGQQLYLSDSQWVVSCPKPYEEDTSKNTCVRSSFEIVTIPVMILLALSFVAVVVMIISKILSVKGKFKGKSLEEAYAMFSAILFISRVFMLGNLWAKAKVFAFALWFMNIACTGVLGIFFYFLYLEPIFIHSPHFKKKFNEYKKTMLAIIITSFLVGVNFIRLIYSKIFGTSSTSVDFNAHYFFVKPLNTVANFTIIFNGIDVILWMIVIFDFNVGNDAWALAVFNMVMNFISGLFQITKMFQTNKFVQNYQRMDQ